MEKKLIGLDLSHIAEGGLQEKLDNELEQVFDNILDLNTEAKAKRKITITLTMSSNEERTVVDTIMEVKSKLAPQNGVATTILVGRDYDTGQVHANELKSTVPGQMYFDENGEILTDIGQPVEGIEQQQTKQDVIDFNKKKVGN
ncbi:MULTISPECIES: hypothetical protein [Streptococcus]|uniref:hypothetical protein n=1 Tax=Streptococcus TaxID=1301 RepID=UPI0002BAD4F6|nr:MULTISPECIES: hypothetical protein [Streptococcus]QBX15985.1 hypothetical protein Javan23_0020 [Streptococcus phage Javan23]QBX25917.1 hypothetical protein Javan28_0020 [Streptococcus phage Javan28]ASA89222.1 hypothetical protein BB164_01135 [Streptococcus agalactiae]EMC0663341.1 hypothetical protein [Streptococcus agalactiae]EPT73236.1 hypothetical protein SAG0067_08150 [Streptococcus agalactiae CCUG 39096 A]